MLGMVCRSEKVMVKRALAYLGLIANRSAEAGGGMGERQGIVGCDGNIISPRCLRFIDLSGDNLISSTYFLYFCSCSSLCYRRLFSVNDYLLTRFTVRGLSFCSETIIDSLRTSPTRLQI